MGYELLYREVNMGNELIWNVNMGYELGDLKKYR